MAKQHRTLLLVLSFLFCLIFITACGSKEAPASEQLPDTAAVSPAPTPEMSPETTEEPVMAQESPSEKPKETAAPTDNQKQTNAPAATPAATDKPKSEASSSGHTGEHSTTNTDSPKKVDPAPAKTAKPQQTAKPASPPAATPASAAASKVHIVEIVEFAFSPSKLTIKAGDSVKFINKDAVSHSATADDKSFDTGMLGQDKGKEVTFSEEGEFSYYCLPHPGMKGTITVEAK